jgi:multimeric flavodoxin WrbA
MEKMLAADAYVVGAPVRNGLTTACYKRFYERITYPLGFTRRINGKHTLAISSVGLMGGAKPNKRLLGLQDVCWTKLSDFLFFKTGIPTKKTAESVRGRLQRGADRLFERASRDAGKSLLTRMSEAIDRAVLNRFMLRQDPEKFAFVIQCRKEKKYL